MVKLPRTHIILLFICLLETYVKRKIQRVPSSSMVDTKPEFELDLGTLMMRQKKSSIFDTYQDPACDRLLGMMMESGTSLHQRLADPIDIILNMATNI